jgi:hypothetical protein
MKEETKNTIDTIEDDYMSSEGIGTKEELILRHIKKISDLSVQELTPSYWEKKPISTQGGIMMSEIYHADMREAYCNAIDFLGDMIMPYADDTLKTFYKDVVEDGEGLLFKDAVKKNTSQSEWIIIKLKLRRMLFQEINRFFERDDFFSSTSYGESKA